MIIDKSKATNKDLITLTNSNYKRTEKTVDFSNIIVKKPWGYEYLLFENEDVAIWILYINERHKTSMHCHPNKNTSLICLKGNVTCKCLDKTYKFDELNGIYLGKKVYHQTSNDTDEGVVIMEIESPVDKFDLVRLSDHYGRSGKAYENKNSYEVEKGLTLEDVVKNSFKKVIGNTFVELGFASSKSELSEMYNKTNDKVILILLNRHIWSASGNKEFEVGQLIVLNDDILDKYNINNNFTYLILSKE